MVIPEHKHLIIRAEINNAPKDPAWVKEWLSSLVDKIDMKIDRSAHFTYWQFPLIVSVVLVFMNYSGIRVFTELVSLDINREFGLLEHL